MAKKDKSRQKKFDTRIDFTPMVDMNMLLITFFMLCTTMIKSQTLSVALPTNEKVEQQDQEQAKQSEALTIIVDGSSKQMLIDGKEVMMADPSSARFFYYDGQPDLENLNLKESNMKGTGEGTLRAIFTERNKDAIKLINEQKAKWRAGEITEEEYNKKRESIQDDSNLKRPVVMIKPTKQASYADVVAVLDEMQINNISRWRIENLNKDDSTMLSKLGVDLSARK
jgi:biopolymer transport protein ExbD